MTKAQQIQQLLVDRLTAAFPDATVKHGWIDTYWQDNQQWPLVTVGPIVSDSKTSANSESHTVAINWGITVLDEVNRTDTEISLRLMDHLRLIRKTVIAPPTGERHNTYGGLLSQPPKEATGANFIQPDSGLPFAGLTVILTTTYSEQLE
jgi:hypothetical protein